MLFSLSRAQSYRVVLRLLPPELTDLVFGFWLGDDLSDQPTIQAYQFARIDFPEGVDWFIAQYAFDAVTLNQILYGAAVAANLDLSLRVLEHGVADDLETAVNLALEYGHLVYIRSLLFWREAPETPFSMYRWLRFCRHA